MLSMLNSYPQNVFMANLHMLVVEEMSPYIQPCPKGLYIVFRKKIMTISACFQRSHRLAITMPRHLLLLVFTLLLAMPGKGFAGVADTAEALSEKILGSPDAMVEIHEYASLTCSHCANFHNNVLPEIKKNYIDTGKVRIVYHDFPLDDLALAASMLARCAGNDRFFPMVGTLFRSQQEWARAENPLQALTGISRMIGGMDENDVKACLENNDLYWAIAEGRTNASKNLGINSTPTFFIDGKKIDGGLSYNDFSDILNLLLEKNGGI